MLFPNIDLNDEIQNLIQNLTHWKLLKDQVYLKFNKRPSISFLLLPNVSSDSHLSNSKIVIQVIAWCNLHPFDLASSSFLISLFILVCPELTLNQKFLIFYFFYKIHFSSSVWTAQSIWWSVSTIFLGYRKSKMLSEWYFTNETFIIKGAVTFRRFS